MDTQAVNSAGNPTVPTSKVSAKSSGSNSSPTPKATVDSVDLSDQAQELAKTSGETQTGANVGQKKLSVTDSNDVVLKIIDPETQKVVKSIPSEEEIQLKSAIRDGISEITE